MQHKFIIAIKRNRIAMAGIVVLLALWYFALPRVLFDDPLSTVIEDKDGHLLGARIADDGQWRFPVQKEVPDRFALALVNFEDRYFFVHPGFNPVSLFSALMHNLREQRIVRGGSTISMQLIRLSRKGKPRTPVEKLKELFLATRLEVRYSKQDILALYASHAPFGGNIVGLEAASWRYFGRSPKNLSWAEAATLAVLPNAPALIFPGRNQDALQQKRNRLLGRLLERNIIDSLTYRLSIEEALPERPHPLPQIAPHLLDRVVASQRGSRIQTTLDRHIQQQATMIVEEHSRALKVNHVYNAAAMIVHIPSGQLLAYVGNTSQDNPHNRGAQVDIITAARSTGSILKPFLYMFMMDEGQILPQTLIADIPTRVAGYSPRNFYPVYDGAVPAGQALARSLNVPFVRMLRDYGVEKFLNDLRQLGFTSFTNAPSHYGLSLILGGAEASLWELTGVYAALSKYLNAQLMGAGNSHDLILEMPVYQVDMPKEQRTAFSGGYLPDAAAIWLCWEALAAATRPGSELAWQTFLSHSRIAWKTGTSFGGRDAWSIGVNSDYAVGVWAGNASGEGRPGLTGVGAAAPIMFDIFKLLEDGRWFDMPRQHMQQISVCRESGYRAGRYCRHTDLIWCHEQGLQTGPCPYHQLIHVDTTHTYRVSGSCENSAHIQSVSWFVLPPAMEWFYRQRNPSYEALPPMRADCLPYESMQHMDILYPDHGHTIYIPKELDGSKGKLVMEAAHRNSSARIFWHLDDEYIGQTMHVHQMAANPGPGHHTLRVVDENGDQVSHVFVILSE